MQKTEKIVYVKPGKKIVVVRKITENPPIKTIPRVQKKKEKKEEERILI